MDEINSSAGRQPGEMTRRKGRNQDETNWGVDATNSVHDETNRNNDSMSRKTNIVSDLRSIFDGSDTSNAKQ